MSRSNPNKAKQRAAKATARFVVEGFTEDAFCRHLRQLYGRDCGVSVDILNARGGSPQSIIETALKSRGSDRVFIVFDTDRPLPAAWAAKSRRAGHIHITPSPCIEAFFLSLLDKPVPADTDSCKRAFDTILPPPAKYDHRSYATIFPKNLLNSANHPILDAFLSAFRPS